MISGTIKTSPIKLCTVTVLFKVDDYLRKSSLTGPEIFMVVFSHEKEEDSVKK